MKYLMTYQNGKKPLRFSKQVSGFAIDAGSLGKVYPVLVPVDSTDSAKTSLRIKLNNQIKAFTTIPSVILPETLQAKTGSTLEDPQGFNPSYEANLIHEVHYNEYEGFYYAFGNYQKNSEVNPHIKIRFSMDGIHWDYNPYDSSFDNMIGYTAAICKLAMGLIFFNIEEDWSRVQYELGEVYYYLIVYAGSKGKVTEIYRLLLQTMHYDVRESEFKTLPSVLSYFHKAVCKPDPIFMDRYTVMFSYREFDRYYTSITTRCTWVYVLAILNSATISAEAIKHDLVSFNTYGEPDFFYSDIDKAYAYYGPTPDWSYNGITWYNSGTFPRKDEGVVGDYTILYYYDGKTFMTKDGGQTIVTVDRHVCGFDPVDKSYICQKSEMVRKGDGTDYDIIAKIYASTDLSTWTLLKTINYGKSPYWTANIGSGKALDTYSVLGFTDN